MEKKITFKKENIDYNIIGEGVNIVLIHGFLESKNMWEDYAASLAPNFRVIAPDLLGHGNSGNIGYVHTMELMAEAIHAIIKHENLKKVVLVGHSMGGYVAMAFADLYPDMVKGICLFQSTARADSPERKTGRSQAIKLVKTNHKGFIRKAIPLLFRYSFRIENRHLVNKAKKDGLKTSKQGVIAALEGMKIRPSREIMLKFPPYQVYLLGGKFDKLIPRQTLIEQAAHHPNVRIKILSKAGHMAYLEDKDAAYRALENWLLYL